MTRNLVHQGRGEGHWGSVQDQITLLKLESEFNRTSTLVYSSGVQLCRQYQTLLKKIVTIQAHKQDAIEAILSRKPTEPRADSTAHYSRAARKRASDFPKSKRANKNLKRPAKPLLDTLSFPLKLDNESKESLSSTDDDDRDSSERSIKYNRPYLRPFTLAVTRFPLKQSYIQSTVVVPRPRPQLTPSSHQNGVSSFSNTSSEISLQNESESLVRPSRRGNRRVVPLIDDEEKEMRAVTMMEDERDRGRTESKEKKDSVVVEMPEKPWPATNDVLLLSPVGDNEQESIIKPPRRRLGNRRVPVIEEDENGVEEETTKMEETREEQEDTVIVETPEKNEPRQTRRNILQLSSASYTTLCESTTETIEQAHALETLSSKQPLAVEELSSTPVPSSSCRNLAYELTQVEKEMETGVVVISSAGPSKDEGVVAVSRDANSKITDNTRQNEQQCSDDNTELDRQQVNGQSVQATAEIKKPKAPPRRAAKKSQKPPVIDQSSIIDLTSSKLGLSSIGIKRKTLLNSQIGPSSLLYDTFDSEADRCGRGSCSIRLNNSNFVAPKLKISRRDRVV